MRAMHPIERMGRVIMSLIDVMSMFLIVVVKETKIDWGDDLFENVEEMWLQFKKKKTLKYDVRIGDEQKATSSNANNASDPYDDMVEHAMESDDLGNNS